MAKYKVTVTHKQTATIDFGALSQRYIEEVVLPDLADMGHDWSIGDFAGRDEDWTVESVEVEPVAQKRGQ